MCCKGWYYPLDKTQNSGAPVSVLEIALSKAKIEVLDAAEKCYLHHLNTFPSERSLPYGDPKDYKRVTPDRGMGSIIRPEGCILSHTNPQEQQKISAVFTIKGSLISFCALPFGLTSAPKVLTDVMKEIRKFIQDWQEDLAYTNELMLLLLELGLLVNVEKSDLIPKQQFCFLSIDYCLIKGLVHRSTQRVEDCQSLCRGIMNKEDMTPSCLMTLIGTFISLEKKVLQAYLHIRPIQCELKKVWTHGPDLDQNIILSQVVKDNLKWRLVRENFLLGSPLHTPSPQEHLYKDASLQGWGAHHQNWQIKGTWEQQDTNFHISCWN